MKLSFYQLTFSFIPGSFWKELKNVRKAKMIKLNLSDGTPVVVANLNKIEKVCCGIECQSRTQNGRPHCLHFDKDLTRVSSGSCLRFEDCVRMGRDLKVLESWKKIFDRVQTATSPA